MAGRISGGESQIYSLVKGLNRLGISTELFAVPGSKAPELGALHYTTQGNWDTIWDAETLTPQLYKRELEECDIWHDWSLSKRIHHAAFTDFGKRCVMTPWGTGAPNYRTYNTVCWSDFQRGLFRMQGYPESTKYIWGGVDAEAYQPRYDEGEYFLYLSRIHPTKRPEVPVELAKKMGFPLIIACDTESQDHEYFLNELRKDTKGCSNITYVVDPTMDQKKELYARAKALILASMSECFGLVIVEAFAHGTPVIVTNDGAYPEMVDPGVTGFLCSNMQQFEVAIRNVDTLDRFRCRQAVDNTFNSDRVAEQYLGIYKQIINGETF